MKDLISSIFSHEIKNSLSSIKFSVEMFSKYELDKDEKREFTKDLINTINNTLSILDEYLNFIKFQFKQKLNYENIDIYSLLDEIKNELLSFGREKGINIYIKKTNNKILTDKFWLKRAIYNIVFNAIKYNKKNGNVNIKVEENLFGLYISISDTGIGIDRKKIKSIFKFFEQIDENKKGFGIGLALSKSVVESFGGKITVKSNENIGTDFILYIPKKPKEITLKKIALGIVPASILLFFGISYFPIYSQNYEINHNGGYISYLLEDGSVLKYSENSKYDISFRKNLYNSKYVINTKIEKGEFSLKAIKEKANIEVEDMKFQNLGTDFEITKGKNIRVAVFDGKVRGDKSVINKKEGMIVTNNGNKIVELLDKVKRLKIIDNILSFQDNPQAIKYQILISKTSDFSKITKSFYTTKNYIKLLLDRDTVYYIKIYGYDKNLLPSMPNKIKFVNLIHYKTALKLLKHKNINEAFLELENSISTIKNYSPLPYFEISKLYYKQKNYLKSVFYIQKAIKIDRNIKYVKLLVDNYVMLKEYQKIVPIIDKLLKKYPNDLKLLYYKSIILKNLNPKQAQKILFRYLQLNSKDKKANLLMSEILYKLHKDNLAKYYKEMAK